MKYRLAPPPDEPGIYAIENETTKKLYVGKAKSLLVRFEAWSKVFRGKAEATSKIFRETVAGTEPADWVFTVLHKCTIEMLDEAENKSIAYVRRTRPDDCLNTIVGRQEVFEKRPAAHMPKSEVYDEDGVPMTRVQIAARLGVTPQAVKKRLWGYRQKGKYEFQITELINPLPPYLKGGYVRREHSPVPRG